MTRRRMTGPPTATVEAVLERATYLCELRGCLMGDRRGVDWSVHHRLPRRMGGTRRDANRLSNLVIVCGSGTTGCHGWLERHRTEGYALGFLLRDREDPCRVPVRMHDGLWLLDDSGGRRPFPVRSGGSNG